MVYSKRMAKWQEGSHITSRVSFVCALIISAGVLLFLGPAVRHSSAAVFQFTPTTGIVSSGGRFVVGVSIDSEGVAINSGEGVLNFDSRFLAVDKISTDGSIFKFWVQGPAFSNSAGTISFAGGLPSPGYTGSKGEVMKITFRGVGAGASGLTFDSGAILANDGAGTNVLRAAVSGQYKVNAVSPVGIPASTQVATSTKEATSSVSSVAISTSSVSESIQATSSPRLSSPGFLFAFIILAFVVVVASILLYL